MQKLKTSSDVIQVLKALIAQHGIPEELRSDNGPQYSSREFARFTKEWGIKHVTSSPRYPQANGEVERAVQTVKSILKKEKDPTKALLAYRSTPLTCGFSPAELLMGRKLRTTVPTCPEQLKPSWPDLEEFQTKELERKQQTKADYDQRHRTRQHPSLLPEDIVYIKDMNTTGTVTGSAETPRSYQVQTPKGTLRRNRTQLSPLPKEPSVEPPVQNDPPSPCLNTRPKRLIKPTWKVKENLGL